MEGNDCGKKKRTGTRRNNRITGRKRRGKSDGEIRGTGGRRLGELDRDKGEGDMYIVHILQNEG